MDNAFLTKTAITERPGWSATLVARLLGEPDKRKRMPGRSNPLALYEFKRVEEAERSDAFVEAQTALAKRKAAAQRAVSTKTDNLLARVRAMSISVERWPTKRVRTAAIESYNNRSMGDPRSMGQSFASASDDPVFLDRITVNYIRHELTQYDTALAEAAGKVGTGEAVANLRKRIYSAIAAAYPELAQECEQQLATRSGSPGGT